MIWTRFIQSIIFERNKLTETSNFQRLTDDTRAAPIHWIFVNIVFAEKLVFSEIFEIFLDWKEFKMSLLPKTHQDFTQSEYWNHFFQKRGKKSFEW